MKKTIHILLSVILVCSLFMAGCIPQEEQVLNLYGIDPWTLDPAVATEMTSHQYITQIFSGLVCLDENLEPAPDIARKWEVSNGGMTYTFYLRKDARFQDGREITAEDVKYSWERACNPTTSSQTAATYLGDIVGVEVVLVGESEEISGLKILDDRTLEVTIDTPKSYFLSKLTYSTALVVDKNNVASGEDWWRQPNGSGPFKLQQWQENNLFVLERNELYYGEQAKVSAVLFRLWGGVPMNMYETGSIDVTSVSTSYIDRVTDPSGPFYQQLTVAPELSFYYIDFNYSEPPFDDVNIRRAFCKVIDKDKITSLMFRNMLETADGILPVGIPGYNQTLSGLSYDVAEAKALIAASSYESVDNLPPIIITTTGWGAAVSRELEAIIYEWRQNLGVEVTVRQLEPQRFFYHLNQEKDQMVYTSWIADYPHPQNFLDVLFRSGADNNHGDYSNPEVDDLLDRGGIEQDRERSFALYQQAEQKLVDDAACLPLWFGQSYTLVKPYVKGYEPNPQGIIMLNKVEVQPH
ncbi:ABC transporter substrate-binding protein [Chloroflexota bacterium]